jgi:hypothetical protein
MARLLVSEIGRCICDLDFGALVGEFVFLGQCLRTRERADTDECVYPKVGEVVHSPNWITLRLPRRANELTEQYNY